MTDEILFTSQEVAGCTIRPWTLGQIVKLFPAFEYLANEFKARGIAPKDILSTIQTEPFKVLAPCISQITFVLAISTNKTTAEMEALQMDDVLKLLIVIVQQNIEYLKNAFGPVSAIAAQLTET